MKRWCVCVGALSLLCGGYSEKVPLKKYRAQQGKEGLTMNEDITKFEKDCIAKDEREESGDRRKSVSSKSEVPFYENKPY